MSRPRASIGAGAKTPAKSSKTRLDNALVARDLAPSRNVARSLIMAGKVFSGTDRWDKPGRLVAADTPLEVRGPSHQWASRGGLKLQHGLDHFAIAVEGRIALDIGASTGGFTDVLISRGAEKVYAVDVGRGQLAWRLRNHPRVVVIEGVNARYLGRDEIPDAIDVMVCDASFIGLETLLPAPLALAAPGADLIALIKPQFEVGKGRVGKGGIVRDPGLHVEVCDRIKQWLTTVAGWEVAGIEQSPITGQHGNKEFLIAAHRRG